MSSNANPAYALRRAGPVTTICVARQGRLCRCPACTTSSFVSTTTVSEVSTTCPPSETNESANDAETPSRARRAPLRAFPSMSTVIESIYDYQDNEASAGEFVGPNGCYVDPSHNPLNFPASRAQPLARTDSASSFASDLTVCPGNVRPLQYGDSVVSNSNVANWARNVDNALQRTESIVSNASVESYQYEEPATFLPPVQVPSVRARALGPTRSNYNLTPTPAIPLGRPMNRRRF